MSKEEKIVGQCKSSVSKEYLEAIKWLETKCYVESPQDETFDECVKIIKQALQRLESVKNANPSEALDCIERINDYLSYVYDYKEIKEEVQKDINTIKQALQRLDAIENASPSEVLEELEKSLNKAFDYGVQSTLDNLFLRGYNTANMLKQKLLRNTLEVDLNNDKEELINNLNIETIKQALIKSQEQEKVLEIIKEKPLSLLVFKTFKIYDKDGVLELDYQYFVDCHKAINEELDEEAQEQVATEDEFELLKKWIGKDKSE